MNIYLDTSSLFKLYQKESGSDIFDELFYNNSVTEIFISEITKVEFVSALFKKVRMKETELEDAEKAIELFDNDYTKYKVVPLDKNILSSDK